MEAFGRSRRDEANSLRLTQDVLKSSEIDSEGLEPVQVRSSFGRPLGIDIGTLARAAVPDAAVRQPKTSAQAIRSGIGGTSAESGKMSRLRRAGVMSKLDMTTPFARLRTSSVGRRSRPS